MANGKFTKFIYKNGKRKILKGKISCKIKNELGKTYLRKKGKAKWKAKSKYGKEKWQNRKTEVAEIWKLQLKTWKRKI